MGRCPARGPCCSPRSSGTEWTWRLLSPSSALLSCSLRGRHTGQRLRVTPAPALQPELGFFMPLNEIKHLGHVILLSSWAV